MSYLRPQNADEPLHGSPLPPVPNMPSEAPVSDETKAWLAAINRSMKRMHEDEAYRLKIAKDLS